MSTSYYNSQSLVGLGNVGIGTTIPAFALDVYTGTMNAQSINITSTANISSGGFLSVPGTSNFYGAMNVSGTTNLSAISALTVSSGGTANIAGTLNVASGASLVVPGTSNFYGTINSSSSIISTRINAVGKTGTNGVCPPVVGRMGGDPSVWQTTGTGSQPIPFNAPVQIQLGSNTLTATTSTVNFPITFTNSPLVFVTATSGNGNIWAPTASVSSALFIVNANTSGGTFNWLAIGI